MTKKRILLAEDDVDDQQFFLDFLQNRDDLVLLPVAQDGVMLIEQLERIADTPDMPDYIILDQNMPKQNGLQTLRLLKDDTRFSHIPVIIYSTYTDDMLIKKGTETGACLVVSKPLSKEDYDKMVNLFIEACS